MLLDGWEEDATSCICIAVRTGFGDVKDLVATIVHAMGEEQICALKDIDPK